MIEPGHHYEWVWLLHQHLGPEAGPAATERAMQRLFAFATRFGQDAASGLVRDAVHEDGTPASHEHRLWPQAERLKAWLAMAERHGVDARGPVEQGIDQLFQYYLDTTPAGTWIEHRTATLAPKADKIPTSSFYHIVLAFAEVLRLRGELADSAR